MIAQACQSELSMHHAAAVVAQRAGTNARVVACNRYGARPQQGCNSVHAEVAALKRTTARNSTVVVVRVGADGSLRESRPCAACCRLMRRCGVRQCIFSTYGGSLERVVF